MPGPGRITEEVLNDPVAAHVRPGAATVRPDWTVTEALAALRADPPAGRVVYFYATDADGRLVGVVPTRRLLLSPPDARIADVMLPHPVAVPESATVLEACEFFTLHRFLAFPVVDAGRRLVGVIDVELYTDELADLAEGTEPPPGVKDEVFQLIGVHLSEAAQGRPLRAAAGRFPWLMCNVGGGLIAAFLSGLFDDVLTWRGAVLALFIPVVLALAESVAMQSVTLALGRLRTQAAGRQLLRRAAAEGGAGLLLGIGAAVVVAGVAAAWRQDWAVAAVLAGAIGVGVPAAALIGFGVPTALHLFNRNPQVAAGPVALAAADLVTLLVYFNLARRFL